MVTMHMHQERARCNVALCAPHAMYSVWMHIPVLSVLLLLSLAMIVVQPTTPRGSIRGFVWPGGRVTVSEPGRGSFAQSG